LKYFILGSFSSGFLLFGFANVYLFTSTWSFEAIQKISFLFSSQIPPFFWGLLLILTAFLFKQGAFPFHLWVCDVYEGSPLSVTMFFVYILTFEVIFVSFVVFLLSL
jgi:NADH-quinone oxidoreductase subunit N